MTRKHKLLLPSIVGKKATLKWPWSALNLSTSFSLSLNWRIPLFRRLEKSHQSVVIIRLLNCPSLQSNSRNQRAISSFTISTSLTSVIFTRTVIVTGNVFLVAVKLATTPQLWRRWSTAICRICTFISVIGMQFLLRSADSNVAYVKRFSDNVFPLPMLW